MLIPDEAMEWLNNEIEDLKTPNTDNLYLCGKLSEALRIRQMLCNMASMEEKRNTHEKPPISPIQSRKQ